MFHLPKAVAPVVVSPVGAVLAAEPKLKADAVVVVAGFPNPKDVPPPNKDGAEVVVVAPKRPAEVLAGAPKLNAEVLAPVAAVPKLKEVVVETGAVAGFAPKAGEPKLKEDVVVVAGFAPKAGVPKLNGVVEAVVLAVKPKFERVLPDEVVLVPNPETIKTILFHLQITTKELLKIPYIDSHKVKC